MRSDTLAANKWYRWGRLTAATVSTSLFIVGLGFMILGLTFLPIVGLVMGLVCIAFAAALWAIGGESNISVLAGTSVGGERVAGKVIPLAILSMSKEGGDPGDFDATTVDVDTIRIGPKNIEPLRHPAEGISEPVQIRDVDADGNTDLVVHFSADEAGVSPDTKVVCFTGRTKKGAPVQGCGHLDLKRAA